MTDVRTHGHLATAVSPRLLQSPVPLRIGHRPAGILSGWPAAAFRPLPRARYRSSLIQPDVSHC